MSAPVQEGDVLAAKYRVEKVLGVGGMGVVVAATHVQLGQKVALKFLLPHAAQNGEAVARFLREAQASVRLRGEHVAQVTDVGTLETGSPYMVMEHLQGQDLAAVLLQRGPLPVAEAADYLLQVCEALAEAHAAGIIHRDLKPANFFLAKRPDGTPIVKVLDFGISKITDGSTGSMTQTTSVMGSPYYMSPEQMRSTKNVDTRTDVWALGVSMFELVTGRVPFAGDTMPELCSNVLMNPTPAAAVVRPDLPAELESLLLYALAKDVDQRCPDVVTLARALLPFAPPSASVHVDRVERLLGKSAAERGSTVPASRAVPPPSVAGSTASTWGASQSNVATKPSGKGLLIGGAVAAVIALGVGGALVTRAGSTPAAVPAVSAQKPAADPPSPAPASADVAPSVAPAVAVTAASAGVALPSAPSVSVAHATAKAPSVKAAPATPVAPVAPAKPPAGSDPFGDTRK